MQVLYSRSFIVLSLVGLAYQQARNPVSSGDFCRRFGHQTTVIDSKLYIDGGLVNWSPISSTSSNDTNTWLLYNDLKDIEKDSDNPDGFPQLHANLTKPATVPLVSGGTLWADNANRYFYLYGGEYTNRQVPDDSDSLWQYDVLSDRWNQIPDAGSRAPQRLAWGASTAVEYRAEGYYYGGWQNNLTASDWSGPPVASNRLVKYRMEDNSWTNVSGPADNIRRAEGVLQYVPASDSGLLIYFGGIQDPFQNGTVVAQELGTILIYDIAGDRWYGQEATGQIPETRRRFCAGAVSAQDYSSHNIYLYGGLEVDGDSAYDDVYILTMPAFEWIRYYASAPGAGSPHGMLSCDVHNAQMIIIGGWFPGQPDKCDAPTVWGTHSLNLGGSEMGWLAYNDTEISYQVPENITNVIGGGFTGGATRTSPSAWGNQDLAVYFQRSVTSAARQPTRAIPTPSFPAQPAPSKGINVGAIAGGVVGGLVGLILILSIILFCLHRRKKHLKQQGATSAETEEYHPPPGYTPSPNRPVEIDTVHPVELGSYQDQNKPPQPNIAEHPLSQPYRDESPFVEAWPLPSPHGSTHGRSNSQGYISQSHSPPPNSPPLHQPQPHSPYSHSPSQSHPLSSVPPPSSPSQSTMTPSPPSAPQSPPRSYAAPVYDDRIMSEMVNVRHVPRSRFNEQAVQPLP